MRRGTRHRPGAHLAMPTTREPVKACIALRGTISYRLVTRGK